MHIKCLFCGSVRFLAVECSNLRVFTFVLNRWCAHCVRSNNVVCFDVGKKWK